MIELRAKASLMLPIHCSFIIQTTQLWCWSRNPLMGTTIPPGPEPWRFPWVLKTRLVLLMALFHNHQQKPSRTIMLHGRDATTWLLLGSSTQSIQIFQTASSTWLALMRFGTNWKNATPKVMPLGFFNCSGIFRVFLKINSLLQPTIPSWRVCGTSCLPTVIHPHAHAVLKMKGTGWCSSLWDSMIHIVLFEDKSSWWIPCLLYVKLTPQSHRRRNSALWAFLAPPLQRQPWQFARATIPSPQVLPLANPCIVRTAIKITTLLILATSCMDTHLGIVFIRPTNLIPVVGIAPSETPALRQLT